MTIRCAVEDTLSHLEGRTKRSANLHPFTTRALFAGTGQLTARQLLLVLMPERTPVQGQVPDSLRRQVKFLRSGSGDERGQKLEIVRSQCLSLLRNGESQNADMVRAWVFVLIHAGVLDALHGAPAFLLERLRDAATAAKAVSALLPAMRQLIASELAEQLRLAKTWEAKGAPNGKAAVFLNYSAAVLMDEMGKEAHPLATQKRLLEVVYPEFDAYGDPDQ